MKRIILIAVWSCFFLRSMSQITTSVINSSGGYRTTTTISLEWSVGEMTAIKTLNTSSCILTEGLLQPEENKALPVQLLAFHAILDQDKTRLNWSTSTEENSLAFEVQCSDDAVNFQKIGLVKAAGNSNSARDYVFYHLQPATGRNFYRLKLLDIDGKFTFSITIVIVNEKQQSIKIYPNPVSDKAWIDISMGIPNHSTKLLDSNGKLIRFVNLSSSATNELDLSRIAAGVYYLVVETRKGLVVKKVVRK